VEPGTWNQKRKIPVNEVAMRLCRYHHNKANHIGLYDEKAVVPLAAAAKAYAEATHDNVKLPGGDDLLALLPPDGSAFASAKKVADWAANSAGTMLDSIAIAADKVELLRPIAKPNKLFLLAGNYNEHIQEGGGAATERKETFPYVFMKPPSTALADPNKPIIIPKVSPDHIDWELELCIVIGRTARHVSEADALEYVAGYTVVNDISDRKFRPNPGRKERTNDKWFDWEHGKWHDSFCPCGPCITTADEIPDPQKLKLKLSVNGQVKQDATTAQQIFPVAAVVAFISDIVTLEPGDLIATGTPAGVGNTTGTYLKPGDRVEAWIESIGTLANPVVAEESLRK
jgi:2-keto-4-pentenoate hydratase/2-oxohepta-3-ene-1,7-dioic acid hydratase in catechol pathway